MSNSSLVDYTKISPNKNVNRNHKIDTITIHCVVVKLLWKLLEIYSASLLVKLHPITV